MNVSLLTADDQRLVADEREALSALRDALVKLDATADNLDVLQRSIQQLDELFLVVIVALTYAVFKTSKYWVYYEVDQDGGAKA